MERKNQKQKNEQNERNKNVDAFSEFLIGNWKDKMSTRLYFQRMESWNKICAEEDHNRSASNGNDFDSTDRYDTLRKSGKGKMLFKSIVSGLQ